MINFVITYLNGEMELVRGYNIIQAIGNATLQDTDFIAKIERL